MRPASGAGGSGSGMSGLRVLAAMSGGVDSATAAARAVDAGHEVTGVHLALSSNPSSYRTGARGCCTLEDARDARRAADVIGIPFYVWDMAERFHRDVVEDFVAEYAAGRTPNPCLRCNEKIKFAAVLDRALALGFDAVCTGHYARIVRRGPAPGRGPRQGPVLRAGRAHLRPARPRHVPARRHAQGRRSAPRRRGAASRSRTSRTATTSASSPTATPRASWPSTWARPPARSSTTSGAVARRARRRLRLHRRPAQGPARRHARRRRQAPLRPRHRAGDQDRDRGTRRGPRRHRDHRDAPRLDRLRPASRAARLPGPAPRARRGRTPARPGWTATRYASACTARPAAWPRARPPSSTTATPSSAARPSAARRPRPLWPASRAFSARSHSCSWRRRRPRGR